MGNRLFTTILLATIMGATPFVLAQTANDRYRNKLQPLLEKFIQQQQIPGLAIAVVEDNHVAYAQGFGWKSLDKKRGRVTPLTLFHMASITKPFVATAVMQLVEQLKVDLNAPVVKYLPYFRLADERYKIITVRQMVTHTSGMPDVRDYEWNKPQYDDGALERYVRSLGNLDLLFEPGTKFAYSNIAYEVLGDLIAKVSGETFDDYVQHHILTPLAMKDSTSLYREADPGLMSQGHVLDSVGNPEISNVYPYNRMHSPSSNLHSNVMDMTRWAMANMNHGKLDGKRILQAATYQVMWKPAEEVGEQATGTNVTTEGISWFLGKYRGNAMVTHSGGDIGFITDLAMLPERKIAVVWMVNCDWIDDGPINGPITYAALDVALGMKPEPIVLKRSLARAMYFTFRRNGIDAALNEYQVLRKRHPDLYDFGEKQLNELGGRLLEEGDTKEAIRVLQLNVEMYSSSASAYDCLGEAYEADENKTLAIANYEKALQLDPKRTRSMQALKKLKEREQ